MRTSGKSKPKEHPDQSALEALLEAERLVALSLEQADREAERLVHEARAAADATDAAAEHELAETLRLLDLKSARQRDEDVRAIQDEADRRTRLFADADAVRIAAIAERLARVVAPAASSP